MSFGIGRMLMTRQSVEDETQGELELRLAVAPAERVLGVVVELGGDHRREVRERFRHRGELGLVHRAAESQRHRRAARSSCRRSSQAGADCRER